MPLAAKTSGASIEPPPPMSALMIDRTWTVAGGSEGSVNLSLTEEMPIATDAGPARTTVLVLRTTENVRSPMSWNVAAEFGSGLTVDPALAAQSRAAAYRSGTRP